MVNPGTMWAYGPATPQLHPNLLVEVALDLQVKCIFGGKNTIPKPRQAQRIAIPKLVVHKVFPFGEVPTGDFHAINPVDGRIRELRNSHGC
jgi:hypothetical protein